MNSSQMLLTSILSYGVGYSIAYVVTNSNRMLREWGGFICLFAFPVFFVILGLLAASIADTGNFILSSLFGIGFIIAMVKYYGH